MSHRPLQAERRRRAWPAAYGAGREEDLRLEALVVHTGGAVAGGGDRILDQHRDLVDRLGRDRLHDDVAPVLQDPRDRSDPVEGQPGRHERDLGCGSRGRGLTRVMRVDPRRATSRPRPAPPPRSPRPTVGGGEAFAHHVILARASGRRPWQRFAAPIFRVYSAPATRRTSEADATRRRDRREGVRALARHTTWEVGVPMQKKKLVPIAAAVAALAIVLAAGIAAVTKSDATAPVAAAVPDATAEPEGADDWMYLQRANADGSIPDGRRQRGDRAVQGGGQGEPGLAGHGSGVGRARPEQHRRPHPRHRR